MEQTGLWPLIFLGLSGVVVQTSLEERVFVFPEPSANSYVLLKPRLAQPLEQFTVCLQFYTDLTRAFSLLSCSSKSHNNEILLYKNSHTEYHAYVGGKYVSYRVPESTDQGSRWEKICMAWNSTTGIVQLWVNGLALPRRGVSKGYAVRTDLVMMLGQEQDSYGGSLDQQQSFVGELADVYMWDSVLSPEQLRRPWRGITSTSAPLVDWRALDFEIKGYVVLEPTLD